MKYLFGLLSVLIVTLFIFVGCQTEGYTDLIIDDTQVSLTVGADATLSELNEIVTQLKSEKNIIVNFDKTTFLPDGKIDDLYLEVDCQDGHKGSAGSSNYARTGSRIGFARYYENDGTSFKTGNMD